MELLESPAAEGKPFAVDQTDFLIGGRANLAQIDDNALMWLGKELPGQYSGDLLESSPEAILLHGGMDLRIVTEHFNIQQEDC